MQKNNNRDIYLLLILVFAWRISLFLTGIIAPFLVSYAPSFPYANTLLPQYGLPQWLYSWASFDGVHYITIAEKGYIGTGLVQAFFPTFPLMMQYLNNLLNNTIVSGLILANLSLMAFVIVFFLFVKDHFSRKVAWLGTITLLLFPTSFFLGAVYSESLFLLLVVGAFYASSLKNWWLAGVLAAIASATRVVGIFLVPALLWESLEMTQAVKNTLLPIKKITANSVKALIAQILQTIRNHPSRLLAPLLGCLGLAAYMIFLYGEFRDPIYFLHVQAEFGSGRQESMILLPQTLWRGVKILLTVPIGQPWLIYLQEFLLSIGTLVVLFWLFLKHGKMKYSWLIFALLAVLLPTTTGSLSSMPRYILVAFPVFIWAGMQLKKHSRWRWIWLLSGILLLVNTVLFIQGIWVA